MTLLERTNELAQLRAWAADARSGRGRAVFVSGEAGIGKSALVAAFVEEARASNLRVAIGHCDALDTPRALGPFIDVCEQFEVGTDRSRDELFSALTLALRRHGPSVIVIEDAHWADDASIEVIAMLARRSVHLGTLLVVTLRSDETSTQPLSIVLGDLASAPGTTWLSLAPLSPDAVERLAADAGRSAAGLHEQTEGNPFFVTELLARPDDVLPASVRLAVLARASRLDEPARRTLDAASIVPGRIEHWLLDALCRPSVATMERCVRGGMLVPTADGFAFRHELARLAIEEQIPDADRTQLHRSVLDELVARAEPDAARIVHHASQVGDEDAIATFAARACLLAAARSAHREAIHHGRLAMGAAHLLTDDEVADVQLALGASLFATARPAEALPLLEAAAQHHRRRGDGRKEATVLGVMTSANIDLGATESGLACAERAVEALAPHPPGAELAGAYVRLTSMHMLARDRDTAVAWGARAIALATEIGDERDLARAMVETGIADVMDGRDEGLVLVRQGIELGRDRGLPAVMCSGYVQLGSGCGEMRRYDEAVPALTTAISLAGEHGLEHTRRYAVAWLARCRLDLGEWDAAESAAADALAGSRSHGIARFVALNTLGWLRARRGDADVWPPLEEALEIARRTRHLQRLWPVAVARAEAGHLEGLLAPHVGLLTEVMELAVACRHVVATGEIALWLRRAGHPVDLPANVMPAFGAWARGESLVAAAELQRVGCVYEAASALVDDGTTSSLRSALATFRRLGAAPLATSTADELRSRGVRVASGHTQTAPERPFGLSQREVAVVKLVAAGMTNPQIASALYISRKTAEHHVSSVLAKLGVTSRTEAAALATREGLTGD